ncbi:AAA family ATPase [Truepera radiovictrix]|uniref:Uncharacterized protein n=1 Tax=Truepera radiovictrix (strain DSM 17093 / CIP 108686 / LMG 22925 / RQ-24) TaxID=649638 RepID=D7CQE2_TRURR|nr:AAA family ATPase [Truepera radiovictrix]ADI14926.1 hypothetical protein Trad_1808 [Truepera radiovictrix DSM 17093]WMT56522.1 AAA family ATPase [Truepera radiovictrix]
MTTTTKNKNTSLVFTRDISPRPANWLLQPLVLQGGLHLWYGDTRGSHAGIDLAFALTNGLRFHDLDVAKANVVYVTANDVADRVEHWKNTYDAHDTPWIVDLQITNEEQMQELTEFVKANNVELVMFDHLATRSNDVNLNSPADIDAKINPPLLKLIEDTAVILLHQTQQGAQTHKLRPLMDAADMTVGVSRRSVDRGSDIVTLSFMKSFRSQMAQALTYGNDTLSRRA